MRTCLDTDLLRNLSEEEMERFVQTAGGEN